MILPATSKPKLITTMDFKKLAAQYKNELLDSVLPFWLEKSQDLEYGAVWTVTVVSLTQISSSGFREGKCGCSRCCITR